MNREAEDAKQPEKIAVVAGSQCVCVAVAETAMKPGS